MDGESTILESRLEIVTRERVAIEATARDVIAFLNRDDGERALCFTTLQAAAADAIQRERGRRKMRAWHVPELLVALVLAAISYVTLYTSLLSWLGAP